MLYSELHLLHTTALRCLRHTSSSIKCFKLYVQFVFMLNIVVQIAEPKENKSIQTFRRFLEELLKMQSSVKTCITTGASCRIFSVHLPHFDCPIRHFYTLLQIR